MFTTLRTVIDRCESRASDGGALERAPAAVRAVVPDEDARHDDNLKGRLRLS